MKNQVTRRLHIELPANRDYTGTISLLADDGNCVAGPFAICGRSGDQLASEHGNPSRTTTLPYGDTPLGIYRVVAFAPTGTGTKYRRDLFGAHGAFILHAVSGDAALAEANGRFEILIHGGPLSPDGRLRATSGGMRIADDDLCVLAGIIGQCRGLTCECFQAATSSGSVQVDGEFNCEEPGAGSPKANWITPRTRRVPTPELIAHGEYTPDSGPGAPASPALVSPVPGDLGPGWTLVSEDKGPGPVPSGTGNQNVDSFTGETINEVQSASPSSDGQDINAFTGARSTDSFTGRPPSDAYSQNPSPDPYATLITQQAPYEGVLASSRFDRFYVLDPSDEFPQVMLERPLGPPDTTDSKTVQPQDEKFSGDAGGNYTPAPSVSGQVSSSIPTLSIAPIDSKTVQPQDEKSFVDPEVIAQEAQSAFPQLQSEANLGASLDQILMSMRDEATRITRLINADSPMSPQMFGSYNDAIFKAIVNQAVEDGTLPSTIQTSGVSINRPGSFGIDVWDTATGRGWDLTTPRQVAAHERYLGMTMPDATVITDVNPLVYFRVEPEAAQEPALAYPSEIWEGNQPNEFEALVKGEIASSAAESAWTSGLRGFGEGLGIAGAFISGYDLGTAGMTSFETGSARPLVEESVRQAGGWSGALAGAEAGLATGAALGIETGPGAIATGLLGGIVGGILGGLGANVYIDIFNQEQREFERAIPNMWNFFVKPILTTGTAPGLTSTPAW
jgi:hypothetical protein